ncbi:bound O-acyltransferase domain-containing protein 2 [Seminavis robusta]|uniref:Bound O-acyltransferase domain-containing protein 2 n=1 Tax=Seminavis robusta TaxID=568900 RepID=A0A9N8H962_9STRA|nr:bound O-acyltransferase domain-containing protein 2 [Seminavis robusta]|eukprot:Sro194_g082970.1 bound O-acyltransferase domain-containing protein 2 (505) ;mRNA; f:72145-73980
MHLPEAVTSVLDATLENIYSLEKYVAPTVVLVPPFVSEAVQGLSDQIGFDVETLSYVLGLLLCYPCGMIMNSMPFGKARHFFSFILGAFLLQFTIGVQWIHHMITSLVVYALFAFVPRNKVQIVVPVFVMVYMTLGHLHRQYINYLGWDLDFTGAQMVITQKLFMMAFNLHDGDLLAKGNADRAAKKCEKYALKELPGLLEYLGYTFCFASMLAGPAYEFTVYRDACDGSLLYDKDGKPRGKIPGTLVPSLLPFLKSFLLLGIHVGLGGMFPLLDPTDSQKNPPVLAQEDFLQNPWFYRYGYMWIGLFATRCKYYFAWLNAEGANNLFYAGFEGFDEKGEPKGWGVASNVDVLGFELAPNLSTLSKDWNKKTSLWLTRYVYIRTGGNLMAVYMLSAFWHGFYPGYYLFFLSVPLLTFCERLAKKKISPYFSDARWTPYDFFCMFVTSFFVEYTVSAFIILQLDGAIATWKSHYFFGHILSIGAYIAMTLLPTPKKPEDAKKKVQ